MKPENTEGGEMRTIDKVKEELAHEYGFKSWRDMYLYTLISADELIDEVAKRYATECVSTLLNKCVTHHIGDEGEVRGMVLSIEKVDEFLFDNNLINELK